MTIQGTTQAPAAQPMPVSSQPVNEVQKSAKNTVLRDVTHVIGAGLAGASIVKIIEIFELANITNNIFNIAHELNGTVPPINQFTYSLGLVLTTYPVTFAASFAGLFLGLHLLAKTEQSKI